MRLPAAIALVAAIVSCAPPSVATGTATPSSPATGVTTTAAATASASPSATSVASAFPDVRLIAGTATGDLMRFQGGSWQLEAHICPQDRGQAPVLGLSISGDGRVALVQCSGSGGGTVTIARPAYRYDFNAKTRRQIDGTTELGIGPLDQYGTSAVIGAPGDCPMPAPTCQTRWLELDLSTGQTREMLPSGYWYSIEFRSTALGFSYFLPEASLAGHQPPERVGTFMFDGRTGAPIRFSTDRLVVTDTFAHAALERTTSLVLTNPRPPSAVIERTNGIDAVLTPAGVTEEHPVALLADGRIVAWRPDGPDTELRGQMVTYDHGRVISEFPGLFARGDVLRSGDWVISKLFLGGATYDLFAYSLSTGAFATRSAGIAIGALGMLP